MSALDLLVEADGSVVSRTALIEAIWPDVTVSEESLTTAISELRRALGDRRGKGQIIQTVHRAGYRLTVPVTVEDAAEAATGGGPSFSLEAYALVQEALRLCYSGDPDAIERAETLSRLACRKANNFAPAHAQHAISASFRYLFAGGGATSLAAAAEGAERACALRPDLAFSHAAMGYALCAHGAHDSARQAIGRAFELDPNDLAVHSVVQCVLYEIGDFRTAGAMAERTASLRNDDYYSASIAARTAEGLGETGRAVTLARFALARSENWLAIDPSDQLADAMRGTMLAMIGRDEEARETLKGKTGIGGLIGFYTALTSARVGDVSDAIGRVQSIIDRGWRHWALLAAEPLLAAVRREGRFKAMVPLLA